MNKLIGFTLAAMSVAPTMLGVALAHADEGRDVRLYAVTVTNLTRGQGMAPPAVIAHNGDFQMFALGQPGAAVLAPLAEAGNGAPLLDAASSLPTVYDTALGNGVIAPGASQTIEIETTGRFPEISLGAMLGTTNDAFMAVRGVLAPRRGSVTVMAEAYDAGTEANSEDCAYIPGPPCGDFNHNPAASEGYVHVHAGIHIGGGGLTPAMHDWRNPVAQIEIRRID
jgi:hypothetical protein